MEVCKVHPQAVAAWRCSSCGAALCDACIHVAPVGAITLRTCKLCGEKADTLTAAAEAVVKETQAKKKRDFFGNLPGAFAYPFKGSGIVLLIIGGFFFWAAGFVRYAGLFGLAGGIIVSGYLSAYMMRIINSSAEGDEEMPNWPDLTDFVTDVLRPYFLILGALIVSFLPAIVYLALDLFLKIGMPWISLILVLLGIPYMPIALLAVALFDSVEGLKPTICVPAIFRMFLGYLVACLMLAAIIAIRIVGATLIRQVPILGSAIDGVVSFYFLIVEMRILGLLYYAYQDRLHWFDPLVERVE